jgi:hypothetical protein
MTPSEPLARQKLVEQTTDWLAEARVDPKTGVLHNVALLGPESRNGYTYTFDAMQAAAPLYDGRPVFVNHPKGAGPMDRDLHDYVGTIAAPRFENGRIRADIQMVGPNVGWVTELAQADPGNIGMSHVVVARRAGNSDGPDMIESIEQVLSVDIVAYPATTGSFAESTLATPTPTAQQEDSDLEEKLRETQERLDRAEGLLALEDKLRESDLPRVLLTERWLGHLVELSPDEQDAEIRERRRLGRLLHVETPTSREKPGPADASVGAQARRRFVSAVRGA